MPAGSVPIEVTRPEPAIVLRIDAPAIRRALNLILDHFDRSAARIEKIALARSSGRVSIVFSATGGGLSAKALDYAFNSVSGLMAPDPPGSDSTGIGLPVARAIVEAHGGRIEVADEGGPVVTLTIAFPA